MYMCYAAIHWLTQSKQSVGKLRIEHMMLHKTEDMQVLYELSRGVDVYTNVDVHNTVCHMAHLMYMYQ